MRCMAPDDVLEVVKRLDSLDWSWTPGEVEPVLRALGLTALDPLGNRTVRFEHPGLLGVYGFVVQLPDKAKVLRISISVAAVTESDGQQAGADLSAAYEDYEAVLRAALGDPDDRSADHDAEWERGQNVLVLQRRATVVALVWVSKRSR